MMWFIDFSICQFDGHPSTFDIKQWLFDLFKILAQEKDKVCRLKDINLQVQMIGGKDIYTYLIKYEYATHPELAEAILKTLKGFGPGAGWEDWPDYVYRDFLEQPKNP